MTVRRAESPRIGLPLAVSAVLHGGLIATAFLVRADPPPALPEIYRVTMVAAPPGPRQAGVVRPPSAPAPTPPAPTPTPAPTPPADAPAPAPAVAPRAAEIAPKAMPLPDAPTARRPEQVATPNPSPPAERPRAGATKAAEPAPAAPTRPAPRAPAAPSAGGGPEGGRGSDVANVDIRGIEFPYPAYLQNIVRQIILRFTPPDGRPLVAEVRFLIRRDGTVAGIEMVRRSGDYEFDVEARAAIEAAGRDRAFNALPTGFRDDVLPVFFSFDPRIIR